MSDFGPRGEYGRIRERRYQRGSYDREQRLQITMAVGAAIMLLLGVGIGFSIGRATAPKVAQAPAPVAQTETTLSASPETSLTADTSSTLDTTVTDETTISTEATPTDTAAPSRPRQLAPANGAVISASRVNLRWSKVTDDSGNAVTYSFEIQDRKSNGTYGNPQTIKGLKATSYSARVLTIRRRWRVWAVDSTGNASSKSVWHSYIHKAVVVTKKVSTPKSSTPTSGTAQ